MLGMFHTAPTRQAEQIGDPAAATYPARQEEQLVRSDSATKFGGLDLLWG